MNFLDTLEHLHQHPDADLDIAEVALQLAAAEYPDLDVPVYLSQLDDWAEQVRPRLQGTLAEQVTTLATWLFDDLGFRGNDQSYYDPRNSYLSDVIDRRLGIPISLSTLAIAVGRRAGMDIVGIGLPGHFIAMARAGSQGLLFDPFHQGQFLSIEACETLVSAVMGTPFQLNPERLRPTPLSAIVLRMLSNLKAIYLQAEDFERAVRIIEHMRVLVPHDLTQRRDLGVSFMHARQPGRAIDHLLAYLRERPDASDRADVQAILDRARSEVARWN